MRNARRTSTLARFALVCLLACAGSLNAATYYISYTDGANGNPGTKVSPWKFHPRMWGWSGSYSHVAGDRYIFKGGDVWPNDCFTFFLSSGWSGTAGNPDYYGVDTTWFRGAAYSMPQFDIQSQNLVRNTGVNAGYNIVWDLNSNSYITIEGIDFNRIYWTGATAANVNWVGYIAVRAGTYITIKGCKFRNWSHAGYTGRQVEDQLRCIIGYNQSPFTEGCIIQDCIFDGENQANQFNGTSSCDSAVRDWGGKILNCVVRNSAGGLFPSSNAPGQPLPEIGNCTIGPLYISYDPTQHDDGIQNNGGSGIILHDTYLFDVYSVPIFLGSGSVAGTYYLYNNVIDLRNHPSNATLDINPLPNGSAYYLYNNIFVTAPGKPVIRVTHRATGNFVALIDMRNNHMVNDSGVIIAADAGVSISSVVDQNNLKQSYAAANALGYNRPNWWKPVNSGVPTVNNGQPLSGFLSGVLNLDILKTPRPQGAAWDIGAYEFASGTTTPGAISLSSATYTVASSGGSVSITFNRTGGSDGQLTAAYSTSNGTAVAGTDYAATSGSITFNNGVTTPQSISIPIINSGATGASRTFNITVTGPVTSPSSAVITITLPQPPPQPAGVIQWAQSDYTVAEAGPSIVLTAQRINGTNGLLTATYATTDGSALGGHDYTPSSALLSWPDGNAIDKTVTIPIIDSGDTPGTNRTFTAGLTGSALGSLSNATVTIIMRDPLPPPPLPPTNYGTVQFSSPIYYTSVTNSSVALSVQRLAGTNTPVTVDYSMTSGTAVDGFDFVASSGTLSWGANDNTAQTITASIVNTGTISVLPRWFTVTLSNPSAGLELGSPNPATVVIAMNAPVTIRATINNGVIYQGTIFGR